MGRGTSEAGGGVTGAESGPLHHRISVRWFPSPRALLAGRNSEPERIGLFVAWPLFARKRGHRLRLVEPHPGVELLRQDRMAVVAPALGLGAIDDADEAL